MPRIFVNALSDFVIQGGMVSFTLADHSLKTEGQTLVPNPPEDVGRVIMREADFAQLLEFLNQRVDEFESQAGRKLGTPEGRLWSAPRLYLTLPDEDPQELAVILTGLLDAVPVACVRLALGPQADEAAWTRATNHVAPVCHAHDVALVVTDHFRLVVPLGLDGVHLEASRTPLRDVRKELGRDRIVGASAGTSYHHGMVLAEAGADYVSFGPIRADSALGDQEQADDELFAWWSEMIETPSVAEGGLTLADTVRLAATADFVVPGAAVWQADDPVAVLKEFAAALPDLEEP